MKNHIMVGTYHKTGSVWMMKVFRGLAKRLGVPFINLSVHSKYYRSNLGSREAVDALLAENGASSDYKIFFDDHSRFGAIGAQYIDNFRGFRIVRSPISIISSAARFHRWSGEKWLHKRRKEFGGLSYQEYISSLETDNARYRFEMEASALKNISTMADFDRSSYFLTVKYEDIIDDGQFVEFTKILAHLGLEGRQVIAALEEIYMNSIFGELSGGDVKHIQSNGSANYGEDWDSETWSLYNRDIRPLSEKLGYF